MSKDICYGTDSRDQLLSMRHLVVKQRQRNEELIKGIDFSLKVGERRGIMGPSGAGKSLSMTAALGLISLEGLEVEGQVSFASCEHYEQLSSKDKREYLRKMIGYMPQDTANVLNPYLGVLTQLSMEISFTKGLGKKDARSLALHWLYKLGIEGTDKELDRLPSSFSGGMKQRVVFAMAIVKEPKLIFVDEPSSALDLISQAITNDLLKSYLDSHEDVSLLYISHAPWAVKEICHTVSIFSDGMIVESGPVDEVFSHPQCAKTKRILCLKKGMLHGERQEKTSHSYVFETKGLSKSYDGSKLVFRDVSFGIKTGEIVGLLGRSGCGKSTLAAVCCGLEEPDDGLVYFQNKSLPKIGRGRRHIERYPIQLMLQNARACFDPHYTLGQAFDEVLNRLYARQETQKRKDSLKEVLADCGLSQHLLDSYPDEVSGGQVQRMAIARSLLTKPKLIIADEIISALDVPIQRQILDLLRKLADKYKISILFIAHDLQAVLTIADRILVMHEGRIVYEGTSKGLEQATNKYIRDLLALQRR